MVILSPTLKNLLSSLTSLASEAFNLRTATRGPCCRTIGHPYCVFNGACCRDPLDGLGYADMCVGGWGVKKEVPLNVTWMSEDFWARTQKAFDREREKDRGAWEKTGVRVH